MMCVFIQHVHVCIIIKRIKEEVFPKKRKIIIFLFRVLNPNGPIALFLLKSRGNSSETKDTSLEKFSASRTTEEETFIVVGIRDRL